MKVLHIVIAHKQSPSLWNLCEELLYGEDLLVLHIDKKYELGEIPLKLRYHRRFILCENRIPVHRGDISILHAILQSYMMCRALIKPDDYVNVLSGEDYPTRPLKDFHRFLNINPGLNFINCVKVSKDELNVHNELINGDFLKCNWPFMQKPTVFRDRINPDNYREKGNYNFILQQRSTGLKKSKFGRALVGYLSRYRTYNRFIFALNKSRNYPDYPIYGGSGWFTITGSAFDEVVQFMQHAQNWKLIAFFEKMKFSDEFVFQTALMSGTHREKLCNSDLRYIDWDKADFYGRPPFIGEEDLADISNSNAFFCRKVDVAGQQLIDTLDTWNKHD